MSYKHFTTIVVGNNPDELLKKYDLTKKVEPYVVYYFDRVQEYYDRHIRAYTNLVNDKNIPEIYREDYRLELERVKSLTPLDLYVELTEDFEIDENTGNAMCTINPEGKYHICRIGKEMSLPLITLNGDAVFQAKKKDVDWSIVHLGNTEVYSTIWDMVMNGLAPSSEQEKTWYENMKNRTDYFNEMGTKERYIKHNTAFWGYAFVDENGWVEMDDTIDPCDWVGDFYDRFIANLDENSLISVYECVRN